MGRLGAGAFGIIFFSAFVARAQAAPDTGVRVYVANCAEDLASRLPAVVKLEIDVLLRERGPTRSPPETIAVRCEEEKARLEVTLEGVSHASTIDLHLLAVEHRARAVALAAAELVHSVAGRPRAPEAPPTLATSAMSRSPSDRPAPDSAPRGSSRRATLLVGGLLEWRGNPAVLLGGGRMAFQYALGKLVVPEFSVDASFGGIHARSAQVAIRTLSAAAHLYFGATSGSVRWELGPGARFGGVYLAGQPDAGSGLEGRTLTAAWGGPELRARVAYGASQLRPALVALGVGAGLVALPVRGLLDGTESVYAVEGPWMSVCAEVGLGL
ncbi:MAG TPA: hypothetical protein VK550_36265 [Polyangiaceae bacterium]|nr:hypothetical protein [Polyangiaceae bacterium]